MGGIKLKGCGHALGDKVLRNEDFEKTLDTSDEWIISHTGIKERHISTEKKILPLAKKAAEDAIKNSNIERDEIGVCIVATTTPDSIIPSLSCMVHKELGLKEDVISLDINAACSGFVYALKVAEALLGNTKRRYALVIGAECMSRVIDYSDRSTCILFGDGAGASVVEYDENSTEVPFLSGVKGDDKLLFVNGLNEESYVEMDGQLVFKFAVEKIPQTIRELLKDSNKTMDDISLFIMHQANERIIDYAARKAGIPKEKVPKNISNVGNMSAASIPVLLSQLRCEVKISSGDTLFVIAFGGGLSWAALIIEVK